MSEKTDKMNKRGGYSYYCNVCFWFHFYCFVDSALFFTSSEASLHWSHRLLTWRSKGKKLQDSIMAKAFLC